MISLRRIVDELDRTLEADAFEDYGPNGVQVPGRCEVGHVISGVSAHAELFERAARAGADMVLVHHGILWNASPRAIDAALRARLKLLLDADMSLVAYHLPLDAHPTLGNNALIADRLGAAEHHPFAGHRGRFVGREARWGAEGLRAPELFDRVAELTGRPPLVFDYGPERVRSMGIVSGAGAGWLAEAIDRGLDAFLTGEPSERVMAEAREAGLHFLAAGHYATETFGVHALGQLLAQRFNVSHEFLDIPNPI